LPINSTSIGIASSKGCLSVVDIEPGWGGQRRDIRADTTTADNRKTAVGRQTRITSRTTSRCDEAIERYLENVPWQLKHCRFCEYLNLVRKVARRKPGVEVANSS